MIGHLITKIEIPDATLEPAANLEMLTRTAVRRWPGGWCWNRLKTNRPPFPTSLEQSATPAKQCSASPKCSSIAGLPTRTPIRDSSEPACFALLPTVSSA